MIRTASKILVLDKHDLYLTYSWSSVNHGICGHTYEVIEYFTILKEHFNVGILLCEDITPATFRLAIADKYNFDPVDVDYILDNTVFINRPSLLKGKDILFTDGGVKSTSKLTLLFDHIFHFACGDKEVKNNTKDNTYILQDNRIYEAVRHNGIDYKKKILFNHLRPVRTSANNTLVYATKNCRDIRTDMYSELADEHEGTFLCLTTDGKPLDLPENIEDRFRFVAMPVVNLFSRFDKYIYTPVPRHFDCSPRFIAECHFYEKEVVYKDIDYLTEDLGLYWRKHDIQYDFGSLYLNDDDEIIDILKEIIEGEENEEPEDD